MRIKARFAIAGTVCTSLIALGVGGLLLRETTSDLKSSFDRQLNARVEAMAPVVATAPDVDRLVDVLSANSQDAGIRVLRPGATEVRVGDVPVRPPPLASTITTVHEDGDTWRAQQVVVAPSSISDSSGQITVQVFAPTHNLDQRIATLRRRVLRISLGAIALAAVLSWVVGGFAALPIRRLRQATAALGPKVGFERKVPESQGVVEVDELGSALNRLLALVEAEHKQTTEALEAARGFSWNAVHELRTPLMSMRTDLDVLTRSDVEASERDEIVKTMIVQHERLTRLLSALHDLARTDLQDESLFTDVDVAEVADTVCESARVRHPGVSVRFDSPDHAWVRGWDEGLNLMVANLVENAIKHGCGETNACEIGVHVEEAEGVVSIVVDDGGSGIAPVERERVFERFVRGETSRTGLGLGLALVRQQVELHGGKVEVSESPLGGARLSVVLRALPGTPG